MRNKESLVFSLISVLSPVFIVLLLIITLTSDKYFLIPPFMFLLTGWIIGLGTGIAALVFSIMCRKEGGKATGSLFMSILGIILNLLWLSGIVLAFPAWMGI